MAVLVKARAAVSSFLLVMFIVVLLTGFGLYLSPSGRAAKGSGWSFFGLSKWQLENLHTVFGFAFSGAVIAHLYLNYRMYLNEIRSLMRIRS